MSTDTLALIGTLVASAVTATWVLRSKLSDVESGLKAHVAEDAQKFEALNKVIKLRRR